MCLMSLCTYQYTTSPSLYCKQMNQILPISFSSSTVDRPCHSPMPQTTPSLVETCLIRYSMPEKPRPDFVGGAGTVPCHVSRHFYHTCILQCNPVGRQDTDAQWSSALTQRQHLWQVGPGIHTAPCISTLPAKYCPLPTRLLVSHS